MNVTIVLPSLDPDEKLNLVVDGLIEKGFKWNGSSCPGFHHIPTLLVASSKIKSGQLESIPLAIVNSCL